ncbi:MAG: bifunctional (p)ppGpp synthetase/guanosine-3',5'-bis(diphosphate) 3'-pyrophosphohydrolase [Chloroflexi bacterium]|nr:bifunctional (p)ppGpp synthetase/guanosine-3',5'-bis(diphosphate) 3'-pyrophosphohydrolase [Chloroflexota bacterium]
MPSSVTATLAPMVGAGRTATTLDDLLDEVRSYTPADEVRAAERLIRRAAELAERAHEGQRRLTGEPFVQHPVSVALMLANLHLDPDTVAAALLHDCVEDTSVDIGTIRSRFGSGVAELVDGVTKLDDITVVSLDDRQAQNLRKVFLAMARDIRVVLIKLADRLHNLQTAHVYRPEKRARYASDTLEIFAPLAGRLGIEEWRWQLEDHAFKLLQPERYQEIASWLLAERAAREDVVQAVTGGLREALDAAGTDALIQSRIKHVYSIEQKTQRKNVPLDEVYDILAVRVIVDDVHDCYTALGVVHGAWRHIPAEFDDYISAPKENGYRSLHTAVLGPDARPIEIQIRTQEMHAAAEYGVAAHWRYKTDDLGEEEDFSEKLAWVRQILTWQADEETAGSFVDAVKTDFFSDTVFVFTPRGEIKDFPAGSTPLDFAYRIHTDIGHTCIGAKVNGRLVPLEYQLQNGDVLEILTSSNSQGPSRNWVSLVHTAHARDKIRQWFKRRQRAENIESGKELLERELRRLGQGRISQLPGEGLQPVAADLGYRDIDSLLAGVGYGATTVPQVINRLKLTEEVEEADVEPLPADEPAVRDVQPLVRVLGVGNLLTRVASCCNPLPGDEIVGFITRGHGISVHRMNCANVQNAREPERLVEVEWGGQLVGADLDLPIRLGACCKPRPGMKINGIAADRSIEVHRSRCRAGSRLPGARVRVWWIDETSQLLPVQILIQADDREGLTHDVTGVIRDEGLNITSANVHTNRQRQATMRITVGMGSVGQMARLMRRLETIPSVYSVARDTAGVRRNRSREAAAHRNGQ